MNSKEIKKLRTEKSWNKICKICGIRKDLHNEFEECKKHEFEE